MRKFVAVNEAGTRIGEGHPAAKLSDADVELIRDLREIYRLSYRIIAEKFEVSASSIAKICRYERRAQIAAALKAWPVPGADRGGMRRNEGDT